jgi:hypothetical protein
MMGPAAQTPHFLMKRSADALICFFKTDFS